MPGVSPFQTRNNEVIMSSKQAKVYSLTSDISGGIFVSLVLLVSIC